MRLSILDRGHRFRTRVLFALIRVASRHPVVDAIQAVATDGRDRPLEDVVIETIEIAEA